MSPSTPPYPGDAPVVSHSESRQARTLALLEELVAIPSLSIPGAPAEPLNVSVQAVRDAFEGVLDWDTIDVVSADGGAPALIARRNPAPGQPTVLLYAHHDVQPAGDTALWESDPFRPQVRQGRLYGRGSADDGAGIALHHHALSVLSDVVGDSRGLGVVVFIEGEEESGSPTFHALLEQHRDVLSSDLIVVADSDNPSAEVPALTTSLRGVVGVRVRVSTLDQSVHSGLFGGPVPDALGTLIRLLATLHDATGAVAVEGLRAPTPEGLLAVSEEHLRGEAGIHEGIALWGSGDLASRLWWEPAITITGLDAPATEAASNTLLADASAKVSLRIPPGVSAEWARERLSAHLHEHLPTGVRLELDRWEAGEGFSQQPDHPLVGRVMAALADGYRTQPVIQGVGGSIPFVAHLHAAFPDAAIAITGVEDRQSHAHGPNESVDLEMLRRACLAESLLLVRLACGV